MYKFFIILLIACAYVLAGVDVNIGVLFGVPAPVVQEAPPPMFVESPHLVIVSPGLYVIPDSPEEIFFVSGFYWTMRDGAWYRCLKNHRHWARVEREHVPMMLTKMPPGQYKRWNPEHDAEEHGHHEHHGHNR